VQLLERNPLRRVSLIKFYEGCRFLKLLSPSVSASSSAVGVGALSSSALQSSNMMDRSTTAANAATAGLPAPPVPSLAVPLAANLEPAPAPQTPLPQPGPAAAVNPLQSSTTVGNAVMGSSLGKQSSMTERAGLHPATTTTIVAMTGQGYAGGMNQPSAAAGPSSTPSKSPKKPLELGDAAQRTDDRTAARDSPRQMQKDTNFFAGPGSLEKEHVIASPFARPASASKPATTPSPGPPTVDDDFVLVEPSAPHPYRPAGSMYDKDSYVTSTVTANPKTSVFGIAATGNIKAPSSSGAPHSSPKMPSNVRPLSLQQQTELKQLHRKLDMIITTLQQNVNHACEIVTAIASVADKLVIEALAHEQLLSTKLGATATAPPQPPQRGASSSSSGNRSRGESFNMDHNAIGNNLSVAGAIYLHSLTIAQDAVGTVLATIDEHGKDMTSDHSTVVLKLRTVRCQ
jgi:hypothetical protein